MEIIDNQSVGRKDLHKLLIENNNRKWIYLYHLLAWYTFNFRVFIPNPVEKLLS